MFSVKEKMEIAEAIEKLLLSYNHPEMPDSKPEFVLTVVGKEDWSFANIKPNWMFEKIKPTINPWNEIARDVMSN